jgi:hypothetical protein
MTRKSPQREVTIVADEVPPHLRELIQLVEEWGTWNPQRCAEIIDGKSTEELRPFVQAVERHRKAIHAWLATMPKDTKQWPQAAEAFLFLVRNWNEAACELYARETYGGAEPDVAADSGPPDGCS